MPLIGLAFVKAMHAFESAGADPDPDTSASYQSPDPDEDYSVDIDKKLALALHGYAKANATGLGLDPKFKIQVRGFHPVFRVAPGGRLLIELVAQFAQVDHSRRTQFGGVPFRGGCTLVASSTGVCRYRILKPIGGDMGQARLAVMKDYVERCDLANAMTPYFSGSGMATRMAEMASFANLHGG